MGVMAAGDFKYCEICGRVIEWRKKWERDWEGVRYCSKACRGASMGEVDTALECAVLNLCRVRGRSKTICPSEAAREVGGEDWRELMDRTRWAAGRLAARGKIEFVQGGRVVEWSRARGAVRLRVV